MSTPDKIEELARKLRRVDNYYAVRIGACANYGVDHWFVRIESKPAISFDTFDELEAWVEGRVKGEEG